MTFIRLLKTELCPALIVMVSLCLAYAGQLYAARFDPFEELKQQPPGDVLFDIYRLSDHDPEAAGKRLEQLDKSTSRPPNLNYQVVRLIVLKRAAENLGQSQTATEYVEEILTLGRSTRENWIIAQALSYQAINAARKTQLEEANKLIQEALSLLEDLDYQLLKAYLLNTRGVIYNMQGKQGKAQQDYLKALSYLKHYPEDSSKVKILSNISIMYMMFEDWEKALEYNQKALSAYLKKGGKAHDKLAVLYLNEASIYNELKQIDQEKTLLTKANFHAQKSGSAGLIVIALNNTASMQIAAGKIIEGIANADKCLKMTREHNIVATKGACYRVYALAKLKQGKANQALYYLQRASKIFHQVSDSASLIKNYDTLSRVYEMRGDLVKALFYAKKYNELNTKMLFDKRQQQLYRLQEKHDAEAREQEISLLSTENALKQSHLEHQQLKEELWTLLSILSVLAIAWIVQKYWLIHKRNAWLASSNKQLYQHSYRDRLTGLNNRRYLEKRIRKLNPQSSQEYMVVLLDIDYFKQINDNYGHDVGDEILRQLSKLLKQQSNPGDICARWGGEEFVFLKLVRQPNDLNWPEKIRQQIAGAEFQFAQMTFGITVSAGVYPAITTALLKAHWEAIFKQADKALYQAKQAGRNHVCTASSEHL